MPEELKKQTVKGVFWSSIERFGTQLVLLITQIILARLLTPDDFGIIGMIIIFITVSQVLIDSGFGNALIQKKDANQVDFSTVFYCNLVISLLLYLIMFISSPLIADFFNQAELKWLLRFVCLVLIFNALGLVQFAIFRKNLNFKTIVKATLSANIISAIGGISLAYLGFGVWALAIQMVSIYCFRTLFFWLLSDWRPKILFSKKSFRELFNFGYKLLISGLLEQTFQNVYLLVIGKLFSAKDLGYYTQARYFQQIPVSTLYAIVGGVTFPAFSRIQDEDEKLLIGLRKTIKLLIFINFPLMLGLAVVAHPLFLYVLGEKWLPAVPYFQLMCIAGMLYTVHATHLSILQVKGRTDLFLKLEVVKKIVLIVALVIGLRWGIIGLVWSGVVSSFIAYFINSYYSGVLVKYTLGMQLKDMIPSLLTSLIMVILMLSAGLLFNMSIGLFIIQILIGILSFFGIAYLFNQEALVDGVKVLNDLKPVKK